MLERTHCLDLVAGCFAQTTAADLGQLFENLRQDPNGSHLVVHFHGGRVSRTAAAQTAEFLLPEYRAAGAYPVFFIWNSDTWTAITANLEAVVQEKAFLRLVRRIGQIAFGAIFDEGGGRGVSLSLPSLKDLPDMPEELEAHLSQRAAVPPAGIQPLTKDQEQWIEQELANDPVLQQEQARIAAALLPAASARGGLAAAPLPTHLTSAVREAIAAEAGPEAARAGVLWTLARYGLQIVKAVIGRYLSGRNHGLYDTVVQEILRTLYVDKIGIIAWNMMKKNTQDAFGDNPLVHGGTAFLEHLAKVWTEKKVTRITLIGHSAGAIHAGNFLKAADAKLPAELQFDVIFHAPACTFRFVQERRDVFRRRVRHLRLFGLLDERERSYWEVPGLFRGSLLYIVAGLLEEDEVDMPLLGMQRYHSRQPPYNTDTVLQVLDSLSERPVWAVAEEGAGRISAALKHGGFDREPRTLASVQHILRNGF
jgi:hypothetical protein